MTFSKCLRFLFPTMISFVVLLFPISGISLSSEDFSEKKVSVVMRLIGHEILLNTGDSTSRVMPIENSENEYQIKFEKPLSFEPNAIVHGIDSLMTTYSIASRYLVEIITCDSNNIVHSHFRDTTVQSSVLPCLGRPLPLDCYSVNIILQDKGDHFFKAEKHSPISGDDQPYQMAYLFIPLLILVGATSYYFRKKQGGIDDEDEARIGHYRFDPEQRTLTLNEEVHTLSQKETELLDLLNSSVNETVSREMILQKVWQDEGDYIGRTLDVYISKLRKKLEADPTVKIINIRGLGYKLTTQP